MLHFPSLFALQLHFLVGFVHFPLIGKPRNWWLCTMPPLRREGFGPYERRVDACGIGPAIQVALFLIRFISFK